MTTTLFTGLNLENSFGDDVREEVQDNGKIFF